MSLRVDIKELKHELQFFHQLIDFIALEVGAKTISLLDKLKINGILPVTNGAGQGDEADVEYPIIVESL